MEIEWRTVQMFLGDEGVSEVSVDSEDPTKIRCSCTVFQKNARCKHSKFMRDKFQTRQEAVQIKIPDNVSDEELEQAFKDTQSFRDFVIKYGKVLVL
jgi:hypothetical protein